ncbi:MAG: cytochrome c biogenesis protein CcdA, partial [Bacillota bacterium]
MGQDVSLLVAFGGGLAAFLSPCILPMIPTYLFFLAGEGARSPQAKDETGVGSWYRR